MDEVLVDALVQKLEAFDKWSKDTEGRLKNLPDHTDFIKRMNGRLLSAEKEIKDLPAKIFMPIPEIEAFTAEVGELRKQLATPQKQDVRHEHHLSKPIFVCIGLLLVTVTLGFLLYYSWLRADQHKENDIKYRYLEVFQDAQGQRSLHVLDSLYRANPKEFRNAVIQQERIEKERFEDYQRMQENQEEMKLLQEKWNQQPKRKSN